MKFARFPHRLQDQNVSRDIGLQRECQRFQPKERSPQPNEDDAMTYARLRRAGLDKEKALRYCQAEHCKIDASQPKHGPPDYKIFETAFEKGKILKGWQMVGKLKERQNESYLKAKGDDGLMTYRNMEEQKNFDRLRNYFVGLTQSSKNVQLPKYQMGNGKEHYFELADYYENLKPLQRTLITDTESFEEIIPKQRREQFRIEPRTDRQPTKRTEEEKGMKQRLKALDELIKTYKEAKRPDDPSIEIILDQYHPKIEEDKSRVEFPSMALIKDTSNIEEGSASAKKRYSILSYRYSKFIQNDEKRKQQQFQERLDKLAQRVLGRINCEFNGTIFGKDFKNS